MKTLLTCTVQSTTYPILNLFWEVGNTINPTWFESANELRIYFVKHFSHFCRLKAMEILTVLLAPITSKAYFKRAVAEHGLQWLPLWGEVGSNTPTAGHSWAHQLWWGHFGRRRCTMAGPCCSWWRAHAGAETWGGSSSRKEPTSPDGNPHTTTIPWWLLASPKGPSVTCSNSERRGAESGVKEWSFTGVFLLMIFLFSPIFVSLPWEGASEWAAGWKLGCCL